MQNYSALPPPELPQMADDGCITQIELQSNGGIVVNVPRYSNAAKGDYLCLYFDGVLFSTLILPDPDTYSWPWLNLLPVATGSAWPADGPHEVWYSSTDAAQNTSASPIGTAIVDRQHTNGLPPPTFPNADASNTITYDSVLQHGGTHVKVPWSTDVYAAGDTVYVYWRELDASGAPVTGSDTSVTYRVDSSDIGTGFKVLIPSPFVTAIPTTGSAEAWYSVIPLSGTAQSSRKGTVNIDMAGSGIYPAPRIPEGSDGWIACNEISAYGVEIDVPGSTQFVAGGGVVVSWQGYDAGGGLLPATTWQSSVHILTQNDVTAGFSVVVPVAYILPIGIGSAQAWYSVTAPAAPGVSGITSVRVDSQHCTMLPPPIFPAAAGDNIITGSDVTADNGTDMNISYPGMEAGDIVTAFWFGYETYPDTPVPGTPWTQARTLTTTEEQTQLAVFHVPAENISPVGKGFGEGKYQVMYKSGGIASSGVTDVTLSTNGLSGLQMTCASGAPFFDPVVPVRPLNVVTLAGPAGTSVKVSLSTGSDAYFDPSGEQVLTLILDESGRASTRVYCKSTGNVLVNALGTNNPELSASASMLFNEWTPGSGELMSYGISTGAVADGLSACGVYMQTSAASTATQVRLTLTPPTSALIPVSGSTTAYINVSTSHAAGFDVIDTVAESVPFTLSLPNTGAYVTGQLSFTPSLTGNRAA